MRERLCSINGTLHIDSVPLKGTKVRAEAPLLRVAPAGMSAEVDDPMEGRANVTAA